MEMKCCSFHRQYCQTSQWSVFRGIMFNGLFSIIGYLGPKLKKILPFPHRKFRPACAITPYFGFLMPASSLNMYHSEATCVLVGEPFSQ